MIYYSSRRTFSFLFATEVLFVYFPVPCDLFDIVITANRKKKKVMINISQQKGELICQPIENTRIRQQNRSFIKIHE